jgi:hypothetical protein
VANRVAVLISDKAAAITGQAITVDDTSAPSGFRLRLHNLVGSFSAFAATEPEVCRLLLRTIVADDHPQARAVLVEHAAPVLDDVAHFVEREGAACVRPGVPVRATLLAVIVDVLARAAAGDVLRAALWGASDAATHALVDHALLDSPPLSPERP